MLKMKCPDCGEEMEWKTPIDPGDDEGRNASALYQCPKCKNIEVDHR